VLAHARELEIDGVLAFGTDIAALTAAHVAENMGLPTHPSDAIRTLTEKHRFRAHLEREGFAVPAFEAAADADKLKARAGDLSLPLVVKPVDSSGSKGVAKVEDTSQLDEALDLALEHSRQDHVIVEEFIEKKGYQLTGDGFLVDGELVFRAFANQHFAPGGDPCQPTGESLPAAFDERVQDRIHAEVQRLMTGLGMRTGALNFDILVGQDG
jgi:biotin carboxylase